MTNTIEIKNLSAELANVNLTVLSRNYERYSYDYDCCCAAAQWDEKLLQVLGQAHTVEWCAKVKSVYLDYQKNASQEVRSRCKQDTPIRQVYENLDNLQKAAALDDAVRELMNLPMNEQLCQRIDKVAKSFKDSHPTVRQQCAKTSVLNQLKAQAVQFRTAEAEKLDAKYCRICSLPRSRQNLALQHGFVSEWEEQPDTIVAYCKRANKTEIDRFAAFLKSEEQFLEYEEKITALDGERNHDLAWCDCVDKLWSIAEPGKLSKCRNYEALKNAKNTADRRRLEIECQDYITALSGPVDFEWMFALDKTISNHAVSLHKIIDDFDTKWKNRMRQAEEQAQNCAAQWDKKLLAVLEQEHTVAWCAKAKSAYLDYQENASEEVRRRCKQDKPIRLVYENLEVLQKAAALDDAVRELMNLPMNEQLCQRIDKVAKSFDGSHPTVRQLCAKTSVLNQLKRQAVQFRTEEAEKIDAQYRRISSLPRSRQNLALQHGFVSEWEEQPDTIVSYCKRANKTEIDWFSAFLKSEEQLLEYEEKITALEAVRDRGLAWCDRVDKMWSIAEPGKLSKCRNYEALKNAKNTADRRRLEIECKDFVAVLEAGPFDFELVFSLNKKIADHSKALHKYFDDFDLRWDNLMRGAVSQAKAQSVRWYQQAMGMTYQDQKYRLLVKAAKYDHPEAMLELGNSYMYGYGVEKSQPDALYWYAKAVQFGVKAALYPLGYCYRYGIGCSADAQKAFAYFQEAAKCDQNDGTKGLCFLELGICYESGSGVNENPSTAFAYYRDAAQLGVVSAMKKLGRCYEEGIGVARSVYDALVWYEKAEVYGDSYAKAAAIRLRPIVSAMEEERRRQELNKYINECYDRAMVGDSQAQYEVGEFYFSGNGVTQSYEDAIIWFEKAASGGNKAAMERLGDCYFNGYGVERSNLQAKKWYEKSLS